MKWGLMIVSSSRKAGAEGGGGGGGVGMGAGVLSRMFNQSCSSSCGIVARSFGFRMRQLRIEAITFSGTRTRRWSNFSGREGDESPPDVLDREAGIEGVEYSGNSMTCEPSGIAFIF